jgi:hypothetical protein
MVSRRVLPSALLNDNRIVLEGEASERLPQDRVYVSPTTRRAYDGAKGDTISNLPPDAVEVDKTTWWFRFWKRGEKKPTPPPTAQPIEPMPETRSLESHQGKWYEQPEGVRRLKAELLEMRRYFPDFELCQNDLGDLLWLGNIAGIGEITIQYQSDSLGERFLLTAQNLTEEQNAEINQKVAPYQRSNITPTGALIVAIRCILAERVKEDAVVPDTPRNREAEARNKTDEPARA